MAAKGVRKVSWRKALATLLVAVLVCVAAFPLSACGQKTSEDAQQIKDSLEKSLEELKTNTGEGAQITKDTLDGYVGDQLDGMGLSDDELLEAYLNGFGYSVGDVSVNGNSALAHVKLKSRSVSGIVGSFIVQTMSGATDPKATLLDIVKNAELADSEADVYISQDEDGNWDTTESLKNALVKLCF